MGNDTATELNELRNRAERMLRESPKGLKDIPTEDIQNLIHELQVYQIELEMQNDELRRTQRELEVSRNKYVDLYDFAPIGYFTLNKYGLITEVNLAGAILLGMERAYLLKRRFSEFVSLEDQDTYYLYIKRVKEMTATQICEMKFVKKDGTSFYGRLESIATQDTAGNLSGWRTAIVNITARRQAEKALAESRDELNSIVRSIPDIIYRLDRNGPISFVSDSIDQLGYRPEGLIGKNILEIVHPEDREIATHRINERRTGKRSTKSLELRLLVANRGVMDFRVFSLSAEGLYISKAPISDTFQGTQGIASDITDRKLAQQELLQREKIQGVLETAGSVCHEMSQPMMVILGCSELALMNASESDPVYDKILKIIEQINRMQTITEKLMKITRYETKRYANIEDIIDIDKSSQ